MTYNAWNKNTYKEFTEKFKPKLTTDDCYTPPYIYDVVLSYCKDTFDLESKHIVRPFHPGGDYQKEAETYDDNTVVIDNPPFSILAEIKTFYLERGIKFFLFAPALTLFSSSSSHSSIVCGFALEYENGAKIPTSFATNLFPHPQICTAPQLYKALKEAQEKEKAKTARKIPSYSYPHHVLQAARLQELSKWGVSFQVDLRECSFTRSLDEQREHRKTLFGGGFLISDRKAAEKAAAEKAAAEKAAAEKAVRYTWKLSQREREIIDQLNEATTTL